MLYDKDVREPLSDFLEETYGKIRIIEEKTMGKSRADMMMVTEDALYGIEIKSDADTYARLERQVKDYNRFFDYNIIAVGSSHSANVAEHVPEYWGIIVIEEKEEEDAKVSFQRLPQPNPKREKKIKFRNQMAMLWRPEIAHIQELNGMHKYASMSKLNVILKIMETVPEDVLKKQLCEELFQRDYTTIAETILEYKKAQGTDQPKKRKRKRRRKSARKISID